MRLHTRRIASKIVCTIGPASSNPDTLRRMIIAGMDVARINFSHGTYDEHEKSIRLIRQASDREGWPVAILQDLPGPKLRVGKLPREPIHLKRLDKITLTVDKVERENDTRIPISYRELPKAVGKGDTIYLADGSIALQVLTVKKDQVECRVVRGGDLLSGKGVNIPRLGIRLPAITL
ncbi:MAG TPA: pyruvate kinase, partial [Candidatus Binatus sp.]|nr:pyruvate kinase [Candidatus Binatus sp.]